MEDGRTPEQVQRIFDDDMEVRYLLKLQAAVDCAWDAFEKRMKAVRAEGDVDRLVECWYTVSFIEIDDKYQKRFNQILFGRDEIDEDEVVAMRNAANKEDVYSIIVCPGNL